MRKVTKLLLTFMIGIFFSIPFVKVNAESEPVKVYLFYGNGCPYCENAISYFASIESEYGDKFDLVKYEVWYDDTNQALLQAVANTMGDTVNGVPYIVIGDKSFPGYDARYNEQIITAIETSYGATERYDVIEKTDFDASTANGIVEEYVSSDSTTNYGSTSNTSNSGQVISWVILIVSFLGLIGLLVFAKNKAQDEN